MTRSPASDARTTMELLQELPAAGPSQGGCPLWGRTPQASRGTACTSRARGAGRSAARCGGRVDRRAPEGGEGSASSRCCAARGCSHRCRKPASICVSTARCRSACPSSPRSSWRGGGRSNSSGSSTCGCPHCLCDDRHPSCAPCLRCSALILADSLSSSSPCRHSSDPLTDEEA